MSDRSPARIDVRGPRFAASITAVLLLIAVLLGYAALVQFMKGRHAVAITRPRAQQVERASERGNKQRAGPAQQRDAR